jgi:hypothetical protein
MVGSNVNAEALSVRYSSATKYRERQQLYAQNNAFHVAPPRLIQSKNKTDQPIAYCLFRNGTQGAEH